MAHPSGGRRHAGASTSRGAPSRANAGGGALKGPGRVRRAFERGISGGRGGKRVVGSSDEDEEAASDEDAFEDVAEASDFDDEEIDEDEAFNDDDDMKYGELFGGGDDDDEEFDEDEEDDLDDEDEAGRATAAAAEDDDEDDLAQLMDSDDEAAGEEDGKTRENAIRAQKLIAAGVRGATEEDEEEDLEELLDSEDDGAEDETREQMLDDIVGERKTFTERDVRFRPVRNEIVQEDPLSLPPMQGSGDAPPMTLRDLMATLGEEHLDQQTVKRLTKISKAKITDVPLAPRIQQRVERKVAYEETAKDITKYQPIVKENREKRTLKFEPSRKDMHRKDTLGALVADFTPRTELEKEIAQVLKDSGHGTGKDAARGELLEMNELAVEDVQARQAKLAKMRAVLFYHEQKAKRLKAIKSKTFHRHNRKGDLKVIGDDADTDEEGRGDTPEERREYLRAQERALLRHKNTSRWAQRAIKKGIAHLPGTREIMQEQLRIGQQLKQKLEGVRTTTGDGDESTDAESDGSDDDGDGVDDPVAERKRRLKAKAAAIKAMEDGEAEIEGENESLFKLPFMARAMEKKKAATAEEARELLKELDRMDGNGGELLSDSDSDDDEWGAMTARAKRASDARQTSVSKKARRETTDDGDEGDSDDDVMNGANVGDDGDGDDKNDDRLSKQRAPVKRAAPVKELSTAARNMRAKAAARAAPPKVHRPEENDDDEDDEDGDAPTVMLQEEMTAGMNNADLMRRAFADDDIEAEFEKEKLADVDAELPNIDAPKNLPGWGAWGGDQRVPKWMKDAEKKAKAEKAKALKNRRDAKLKHVIISEKYDKKAAAFNVESLPHGFSSKAAYEGTMRHPLGLDTNTDAMFSKLNAPKVLKATGAIIKPLKLPKNKKPHGKAGGKAGKR